MIDTYYKIRYQKNQNILKKNNSVKEIITFVRYNTPN